MKLWFGQVQSSAPGLTFARVGVGRVERSFAKALETPASGPRGSTRLADANKHGLIRWMRANWMEKAQIQPLLEGDMAAEVDGPWHAWSAVVAPLRRPHVAP